MNSVRKVKIAIKKNLGALLGHFNYFNTKVYFPKNSLIFKIACKEGIYDKEILNFINSFLKEDGLFIDVGTNIGLLSIPVLHNFKKTEVISFEPSPGVLPYLQKTHKDSIHKSRWKIYDIALGDFTGDALFRKNTQLDSAFDGLKGNENSSNLNEKYEPVKVTALDHFLNFPMNKYSSIVLKIDVEGFEYKVLMGSIKFIEENKPFIVIEIVSDYINKYDIKLMDFITFANRSNYNLYGLSTLNKITTLSELKIALNKNMNFILLPN